MRTYPGGVRICTWTEHQGTPREAVFLGGGDLQQPGQKPTWPAKRSPCTGPGGGGGVCGAESRDRGGEGFSKSP